MNFNCTENRLSRSRKGLAQSKLVAGLKDKAANVKQNIDEAQRVFCTAEDD